MALVSFQEALANWVTRTPDRLALTCGPDARSFAALEGRSNRLARRLLAAGIGTGDMVAIILPNSADFVEAIVSVTKAGAMVLPLSAKLPAPELAAILELAAPKAVIAASREVAGDRTCIILPNEAALLAHADDPLPVRHVDPWFALTSGGSTGRPKLIVSRGANQVDIDQPFLGLQQQEIVLIPGPLYHGAPFAFTVHALLRGSHVIVMPRFDAGEMLRLMEAEAVNFTIVVPTMMHRIWQLEPAIRQRADLGTLRAFVHMGAACPAWLKEDFIDWLGADRIHEFYSNTEQLLTTWITGEEWLAHRGSVGRPIRGRLRIIGDDGQDLPPGEIGEMFMLPDAGTGSSYHYLGATPTRRPDGWESTGDLGSIDRDGYLFLCDRRTDMIVSGGANIYPAEIEAVLDGHPSVLTSAVIGLPDDEFGASIHAIIETSGAGDAAALKDWVRQRLVAYKVPRSFEFVSTPLRSESGKLRRSALREERVHGGATATERKSDA